MTVKTLVKRVLGLKPWQPIEGLNHVRRVISFVKARQSLMFNQYPRWVIVELTTRCNSQCTYCPRPRLVKQKRLPPNRQLPFKSYLQFLHKLRRVNPRFAGQVIYGGMGEPTLYKDFKDVLEVTKNLFPHCETVLMTNGITLKAVSSTLINRLDVLSLSLNTFNKETYRKLNRVDAFSKVVENTEYFLKLKGSMKPSTKIQVLLMDVNESDYPKFEKHWQSRLNANDTLVYERFHNFAGQITVSEFSSTTPQTSLKPCIELFESLYVLSNGNLYPCCGGSVADCLPDHGGLLIGNIRDDLEQVLNGQKLLDLRELHKEDRQNEIRACSNCDMWKGKGNAFIKIGAKWR